MASAKASKKQTLGEFRAWLSGVEEMQSDDWAPDLTQWRRIRARIDEITEGRSVRSDEDDQPTYGPARMGPSTFQPMGQQVPAHFAPPTPPPFMNTSGIAGAKISTPVIDTSDGKYASSLE